jgi:hypothetical protein
MTDNKELRIWWDDDLNIARVQVVGVVDEAGSRYVLLETTRIAQQHGEKIDWLIDLSQMTMATSKARKILAEASAHPSIRKYAFAGASTFIRTVANFIHTASGQKNARYFTTEAEALAWIKEGKDNG